MVSLTFSAEGGGCSSLTRQLSAVRIKHGCLDGDGGEKCQSWQTHTHVQVDSEHTLTWLEALCPITASYGGGQSVGYRGMGLSMEPL